VAEGVTAGPNGHVAEPGFLKRMIGEQMAAAVRRAMDDYRLQVEDPEAEDWPLEKHLLEFGEALAEALTS
jgi:hypothetical protein